MRAYLDYNATAPLRPEARSAMLAALDLCGNPSSIHAEGRAARASVEDARRQVAALAGAAARDVVFCASGTEAAATALAPGGLQRLIVGATEHVCVLAGHRFAKAETAPRLPNTLAFAAPGVAAATLLMRLDLEGVAVSSGSACSSGKVGPSHVLAAMGIAPELGAGAIRVSLGWASVQADVEAFAQALRKSLSALRGRARQAG